MSVFLGAIKSNKEPIEHRETYHGHEFKSIDKYGNRFKRKFEYEDLTYKEALKKFKQQLKNFNLYD